MLKKNIDLFSYFCICISCFLISVGICILISPDFDSQITNQEIVRWLFITSLIMTVFLYNQTTVFFGIMFGVIALWGVFTFFVVTQPQDVISFFDWCIKGLPTDSDWYSKESVNLVHIFVSVGICASLFIVGSIPYMSRLVVIMSIALITVGYVFSFVEYNKIIILFVFTGIFTICSIDKFELRKQFINKKHNKFYDRRWVVPITSLVLCLIISSSALLLFDNDKKYDFRNRFCSNIAADFQSFTGIYSKEQKDFTVTLYDLGLQNNKDYIGGDLPDSEHSPLAVANLNKSFNVKITSFDTFTGYNWKTDFDNSYRINGPFKDEQTRYLSNNLTSKQYSQLKNVFYEKNVTFSLNVDTPFLPSIGQVTGFTENSKTKNPTLFNNAGQLFSYFGQSEGFSYTLDTLNFKAYEKLGTDDIKNIEKIIKKSDPMYTKDFVAKYTKPIANFSDPDSLMTGNLNKNSPFEITCKIMSLFSAENGYTYSKKGFNNNKNVNVVKEVFNNKKGHCVYYATAAIALLRHYKIPSRLAAGYRTVRLSRNEQLIDSYYPYCWVECYFPNLGWVSFDPSPKNKVSAPTKNPLSSNKPNKQQPNPEKQEMNEKEYNLPEKQNSYFAYILAATLLMGLIYLISRGFWANKLYNYDFVTKRFKNTKNQFRYYFKDIQRQIDMQGNKIKSGQTLREYFLCACETLEKEEQELLVSTLEIFEALCYGKKVPCDEDIRLACETRVMLEEELKEKLNPIVFTLKRRIFLPLI